MVISILNHMMPKHGLVCVSDLDMHQVPFTRDVINIIEVGLEMVRVRPAVEREAAKANKIEVSEKETYEFE